MNPAPYSAKTSMKPDIAEQFIERFPRYTFSLREWHPLPLKKSFSKKKLSKLPLCDIETLFLYGLDTQAASLLNPWLQKSPTNRLIFLEPLAGKIAGLLELDFALDLLQNNQIEIYHLPKSKERTTLIEELSEKRAHRKSFLSFCQGSKSAYYSFKKTFSAKIALANAAVYEQLHCHRPLYNLRKNLSLLPHAFYANRLKNAFQGIPFILCGAGPSLEHSFETLRRLENHALIFAGGSAIAALSSAGIEVHGLVAIDPNEEEFQRMQQGYFAETPLFFSSRLHHACSSSSNGPLGYIRSGMAGMAELWFEEELGLHDTPLGTLLNEEALSVTTLMAALAVHFGCNPILLDGVDLSYTDNRRYALGIDTQEEEPSKQMLDQTFFTTDRQGKKVKSALRWQIEARVLGKLAMNHQNHRWIQCSKRGIPLKGMEFMELELAVKNLREKKDLRGLLHQALSNAPMPSSTKEVLEKKREELQASLLRAYTCLNELVKKRPGMAALAEIELKEELSYSLFFQSIQNILEKEESIPDWKPLQTIVQKCCEHFVDTP